MSELNREKPLHLAEIDGPGAIQHIWMTPAGKWRYCILRFYWDNETEPSVECPVGDFFAMGWGSYAQLSSLAICVNPGSAFNCYWTMPFRKKCRITMENIGDADQMTLYYQIDYTLTDVPADAGYFHAQFRRTNPNVTSDYTIVDGIKGKGHYVGVYLAWGVFNNGWWGEGEIKFFIDGDTKFPTICGTGTEDYFCGSYDFDTRKKNAAGVEEVNYTEFSTPYTGLHQVIRGDGHYAVMQRFGIVPLAYHGSCPLRQGPESNYPGSRMATGRAVSSTEIRYCISMLLVSERTSCQIPCRSRMERTGSLLINI